MKAKKLRRAKVNDMVIWAKDRLLDDLQAMIDSYQNEDGTLNYAISPWRRRDKINKEVMRMAALLNLPEDVYFSLNLLRKAGYWNGAKDTWWESGIKPPVGYRGQ